MDATALLVQALRDPTAPILDSLGIDAAGPLVAAASRHRVLLVLGWVLRAAGSLSACPEEFVAAFQQAEHEAVAVDCVRQAELVDVLDGLAAAGVRVILFKGASLAQTHYPAPHLRVRTDTDLLVPATEMPTLEKALLRLGYIRPPETSGRLVSYQSHYAKTDRYGVTHALDVHWKISNLQTLAERFTLDELWQGRVRLSALGSTGFTVRDVHALLLATVHRAGHHPGSRDLLWLYDLHLLASRLTPQDMLEVQELAGARGLSRIVAEGLALARDLFGTATVDGAVNGLFELAAHEKGAEVVRGPWSQADVLRVDFGALSTWRARGRLLREHLLPPVGYMRSRYGIRSALLLPFLLPGLYVWRAVAGAPRWLRDHHAED